MSYFSVSRFWCATTRTLALPLFALGCRQAPPARHALDPLDGDEIRVTRSVLQSAGLLTTDRRVMLLDLHEPSKTDVLSGRTTPREAFVVLYDARRNTTGEAVVDVGARVVRNWRQVPGVQPALDAIDGVLTDSLTRASVEWRARLAKRGLSSSDVAVFGWSAGAFGAEDSTRDRLVRALTYVRASKENEMARPVEGLVLLLDLTARRVVRIEDTLAAPVPNAESESRAWRPLPPPISPEGPTPTWSEGPSAGATPSVEGQEVRWRRWHFRVAVRPREGLVLYTVRFDDGSKMRSVMYRASLSEMVVPYGDPGAGWYFRNSFHRFCQ